MMREGYNSENEMPFIHVCSATGINMVIMVTAASDIRRLFTKTNIDFFDRNGTKKVFRALTDEIDKFNNVLRSKKLHAYIY